MSYYNVPEAWPPLPVSMKTAAIVVSLSASGVSPRYCLQTQEYSRSVYLRLIKAICEKVLSHFKDIEYELESFAKDTAGQKETLKGFYRVGDMFDFDNLGFTNTVGTIKYLSCADCDVGPIGYHDLTTKIR